MQPKNTLDSAGTELLFTEARTYNGWLDKPVDDALLRRIYALARMGPTSANTSPMRIVYVKSAAAKEKLRPAILPMNVEKSMKAPATAIIAYDATYWEKLPQLMPARDMRPYFAGQEPAVQSAIGRQSAHLGAGYFILAARALGLDCGPMGGFDPQAVDAAFFPDGAWRALLLINLGYGDPASLYPRAPRLPFDEAARID